MLVVMVVVLLYWLHYSGRCNVFLWYMVNINLPLHYITKHINCNGPAIYNNYTGSSPLRWWSHQATTPHHTTSHHTTPHHTKSHQITTQYHHTISNPTTSPQQLRREYRHADTDVTTTPHYHTKLHNITTPHHTKPHSNWGEKTSLLRLMSSEQWQFVSRTDWAGDVNTGLCRPDNWAAGSDPVCFISSPAQPMITVSVSVRLNWGRWEEESVMVAVTVMDINDCVATCCQTDWHLSYSHCQPAIRLAVIKHNYISTPVTVSPGRTNYSVY